MAPETKEQKEKRELIYFRERARSKRQILQVCKCLCWFLIILGIVYFVFVCAIIGVQNMHFGIFSKALQILLWGLSILWLFWGSAPIYPIYRPIMKDAGKWVISTWKRIRAAINAWKNADNKAKVPK